MSAKFANTVILASLTIFCGLLLSSTAVRAEITNCTFPGFESRPIFTIVPDHPAVPLGYTEDPFFTITYTESGIDLLVDGIVANQGIASLYGENGVTISGSQGADMIQLVEGTGKASLIAGGTAGTGTATARIMDGLEASCEVKICTLSLLTVKGATEDETDKFAAEYNGAGGFVIIDAVLSPDATAMELPEDTENWKAVSWAGGVEGETRLQRKVNLETVGTTTVSCTFAGVTKSVIVEVR